MVIGILSFCMMLLFQPQAMGGMGITSLGFKIGSYFCKSAIKGGAAPTVIDQSFLFSQIDVLKASLACTNGGQTDVRNLGQGGTIEQFTDLSTGSEGEFGDREKGKFYVSTYPLCWTTEEVIEGNCDPVLFDSVSRENCRNNNWVPEQYMIQIAKLTGQIKDCSTGTCTFSEPVYVYCETKSPTNIIWVEGENECDPSTDPYCTCELLTDSDSNTHNICTNVTYLCVDFGSPIAWDDSYSVRRALSVTPPGVLSNDYDTGNSPTPGLSAEIVDNVTHGALTLNADGSFTYTPEPGYSGGDSFTYRASDGSNNSNEATVTLTVK
jgi:hypothetical protein